MEKVIANKYEVLSLLGQGGMGVVFKVRHREIGIIRALKMLPSYLLENQEMVDRLRGEARVMARLTQSDDAPPNIVKVFDFDRDGDRYYLLMQYIQGKTLKDYLQEKGPLPLPEITQITRQVASALAYAHNHTPPVVHRDIKPANIMIEDASGRAVVMDFGIAKDLGESDRTRAEAMVGTVKYSSPEQLRHERLDGRADIYSLGLVLYEMYTGKQFFAGLSNSAVLGKVLFETQEHAPQFDRPVLPQFKALVTKAIAKNREQRYRRMEDLLQALEACRIADDETQTLPLPPPERGEQRLGKGPDAVQDIDEQIRELEEEKQRRLVLPLQRQARQAQDKALRSGAPERAPAFFQEALTTEEKAGAQFQEKHYSLAQETYREALDLWERAEKEAVAVALLQETEQKRRETEAAKLEAERYGAWDKARTSYGRGLSVQAQADELWEQKSYLQAAQLYQEAKGAFENAQKLAYLHTLKEEAEAAQALTVAGKEAAEREEAKELAPGLYYEGVRKEQEADSAREREEFAQAQGLHAAARQKYGEAREQARRERHRRRAVAAQQQVKEAQEQAEAKEAREYAPDAYLQAFTIQRRGDVRFAAQEYEHAALEYDQAREGYEQTAREAEQEYGKRTAAAAYQRLQQAQTQAAAAGAQERLQEAFAQAHEFARRGQERQDQQDFLQAAGYYEQAEQHFLQLAQAAALQAAQERAESARQRMSEAREKGEALKKWGQARWREAQGWEADAEQAYQAQDYGRAVEGYNQAQRTYERARTEAEEERLRHEALDARQQAQAAREEAEQVEAARYAAEAWNQGGIVQGEAEQLWQAQELRQAEEKYRQAAVLFRQAAEAARQELARHAAATARQHVDEAQAAARQAGAPARFAEEFARSQQLAAEGRDWEERQDFSRAATLYRQAARQFVELRDNTVFQTAKEQAEAARRRMGELKEWSPILTEWLGAKWAEAQKLETDAEHAWRTRDYGRATELFAHAGRTYEEARVEAEAARAYQQAMEARRQAEHARSAADAAEASQYVFPLYRQAAEEQRQGEHSLANNKWEEAAQRFAQAVQFFHEACRTAQEEKERQLAAAVRQRAERAHQAAEKAGAAEQCEEEFAQARHLFEQGRQSETQQQYSQALQSYEQAAQRFTRLRRQILLQEAKSSADAARQLMLAAKEQRGELEGWARARWAEARQRETAAEQAYQNERYEQAGELYEQTQRLYEQARREAEREWLQHEARQAQQQATAAKEEAAVQEQAERYAAARFAQGVTAYDEAEQRKQAEQFSEAAQGYRQARALFEQAKGEARRERARQETAATRQHVETAQKRAQQVGAAERFAEEFTQARRLAEQGKQQEAREEFAQALSVYEQAIQRFGGLRDKAVQADKEWAETARRRAQGLKQQLSSLTEWLGAKWTEAQQEEAKAELAWQEHDYGQAAKHYEQAYQSYETARKEAEKAQAQHQAAIEAQQRAQQVQEAAEQAEGPQYARTLYEQARDGQRRGEQSLEHKQWEVAREEFVQAAEVFTEVLRCAQQEKAKQAAIVARENALAAQKEARAGKGMEFFPGRFTEAAAVLREAEQAFNHEGFGAAQTLFEKATSLFQQIGHDTALYMQKQGAEQARKAVSALQAKTQTARGRQKRQAERALAAGDHFFEQQQYDAARASYHEAAALFATLVEEAARRTSPSLSPQRLYTLLRSYLLPGIAVLAALALVLWIGSRFIGQGNKEAELNQKQQAEQDRQAELARKAEQDRQAKQAQQAEQDRQAELARKAEQDRQAQQAEQKRQELVKQAEQDRQAQLARKAEQDRQAQQAEQDRQAKQAEQKRQAELARKAEQDRQAELARKAEQERQAKLAQQAEQDRQAELARKAEQERQAQQAEQKRQAELARKAKEDRQAKLAKQTERQEQLVRPLAESEIRAWLEACSQAFAKKDIAGLVKLGMVSRTKAQALEQVLEPYRSIRVEWKEVSINIKGTQATIFAKRTDTIDGHKTPPVNLTFVVEKEASGQLVGR